MKLKVLMITTLTLILVLFSSAILLFSYYMITNMVTNNFYNNVERDGELGYQLLDLKYPGDWEINEGKLYKGEVLINDNDLIINEMQDITGDLATIFMFNTRIATTVTFEDGSKAVGTTASEEVVNAVINNGQIYHGQTKVLGRDFTTYYRPFTDVNGKVIGMWFTGVEKTTIKHDIEHIMTNIVIILAIMLLCAILLAYFFGNVISKKLQESEEKYRVLLNNAGDAIIIHNHELNILAVNSIACRRYGYSEMEMLAGKITMLGVKQDPIKEKDFLQKLDEFGYVQIETIHKCKDGTLIPTEVNSQGSVWDGKQVILTICRDISKRKKVEEALKEKERLLQESQKVAHIGSFVCDLKTGMWSSTSELDSILGINKEYIHSLRSILNIVHPEWQTRVKRYHNNVLKEKRQYDYEFKIIRNNDLQERWIHVLGKLELDEQGIPVRLLGTTQDITDRKKIEHEILHLSYRDVLTSLYNRRFYEEEIRRLDTERNLPISVIMADVNSLKFFNDAFGHGKGDELLQKAAMAIKSACRADDIVARWGGDEFVVLLPKTDNEDVKGIVKRIKELYSNESVNDLRISISMGWSTKNSPNEDIVKIINSAEDFMYKHKIVENEGKRGNTITTIINTLHEKNPREEQHSKRVSEISEKIGIALNLSEIEVSELRVVGLIHDIGKIAIEEGILNKPGMLTNQELEEIKRHPEIGFRILSSTHEMLELADCILSHHERWDGNGYPRGLKREEIPRAARIIALADSYDAMLSERPYRSALSEEMISEEIRKGAGNQFDPEIAKIFLEKVLDINWIKDNNKIC